MSLVSPTLELDVDFLLFSLIGLESDSFAEVAFQLGWELDVDLLFALFLELEYGGSDGEEALFVGFSLKLRRLNIGAEQMILGLATGILYGNGLLTYVSDPTVTTVDILGPYDTGPLSHGNNGHLNRSSIINDHKLFLQISQIHRPEPDRNRNSHSRGNIATVFPGINYTKNIELLLAQWGYLDSL